MRPSLRFHLARRLVVVSLATALMLAQSRNAAAGQCIVTTKVGPGVDVGTAVAIQTDGKIVLAGYFSNGSNDDIVVARYNADFTLDRTFDLDGLATTAIGAGEDRAEAIAIQTDGKIVVGGHKNTGVGNNDFALVRYNTDGSLDTTFNGTGIVTTAITGGNDEIEGVAVQADGKIVVAGWSQRATLDFVVARYNANGTLDTAGFNSPNGFFISTNGVVNDAATAVAIQADGKIVLGGWANNGGNDDFAVSRFNTNGTLDGSFGGGSVLIPVGTSWDRGRAVVIQPDGKILLAGESRSAGWSMFAVVRLNTNGSLDTAGFNPGGALPPGAAGKVTTDFTGIHDEPYGLVIQSDNKIVAGGYNNWDGGGSNPDFALARYNVDGSPDNTFDVDSKVTTAVGSGKDFMDSLAIQTDGRIVAAGYSSNGNNDLALVRYLSDGSVDPSCGAPVNFRSIGTRANDTAGSVTATAGSAIVTGAGTSWLANNRGRGDRMTIDAVDYTILRVDSDTQLQLATVFNGVSGSGKAYTIARKFATLAAWEDCIDGPGGAGCENVASASLVADNRTEIGVAFDDGASFSLFTFAGSTTDATHTITLTADGDNRHYGLAGQGAVLDIGAVVAPGILINDGYITVEWLELTAGGAEGITVQSVGGAFPVTLRYLLFQNVSAGDCVYVNDASALVDFYNNLIYTSENGININAVGQLRAFNNTIYNIADKGITSALGSNPQVTLRNNLVHTTVTKDFNVAGLNGASSNNMGSDGTGATHNGTDTAQGAAALFANPGANDYHLRAGSDAVDAGADLSSFFSFDIDAATRVTTWDIGADDLAAVTAVELVSFEALARDGAVELTWRTASELSNLGFHLYRARDPNGPYERLTDNPIPGLGSSPVGASYQYVDTSVSNGTTYYYELEDIETTGELASHGPVSATPQAGILFSAEDPDPRIRYGQPQAPIVKISRQGRFGAVIELETSGFEALVTEDGLVRVLVPGFEESLTNKEEVSLPTKLVTLDAVADRGVALASVRAYDVEAFPGLHPVAGAESELVASPRGVVRASRRRAHRGAIQTDGSYPEGWARIVSVGFQGERKRAWLELSPLRWDGRKQELLVAKRLVVRVSFAARETDDLMDSRRGALRRARAEGVIAHLATRSRGLYAIAYEDVFRRGHGSRDVRLTRQGKDVAFHLEPSGHGFGPGVTLYFFSEGGALNPFGSEAVYALESGDGHEMEVVSSTPSGSSIPHYWHTERREENHFYQAGLLEAPDLWLWDVLLSRTQKSFPFSTSDLARTDSPARLRLWLQGTSDDPDVDDHHVRVLVNGFFVGETQWDGRRAETFDAELPPGALVDGDNRIEIENVGDAGAPYSMVMLDRFEVRYPRRSVATDRELEGVWDETGAVEVSGLSAARIVDLTSEPRWIGGAVKDPLGATRFQAEGGHAYFLTDYTMHPEVRQPRRAVVPTRKDNIEWLLVGPQVFLEAAGPLVGRRRAQGLDAEAVAVEDLYDRFGYGERTPEAIAEFLKDVYQPSLKYVVLLGDGTYDYKDYLETGVENRLPPLMVRTSYLWTASDPTYAAVHGDDPIPDVAIGRIPAASVSEVRSMVSKILAYEDAPTGLSGTIVLAADDADEAGDFVGNAEALSTTLLSGRNPSKLYLPVLGPDAMRGELKSALEGGVALMSYIGHGGINLWAEENVFNTTDVMSLAPQPNQPVLLTMNCLNGYFHFPYFDSLSEAMVKADRGGAIAAFSPSGLSLDAPAHRYHQLVLEELLSGQHERLGDAVLRAQVRYATSGAMPELLSIYHLFGDPALLLSSR